MARHEQGNADDSPVKNVKRHGMYWRRVSCLSYYLQDFVKKTEGVGLAD